MSSAEHCRVERLEKPYDSQSLDRAVAAYLVVGGMGCENCANRVNNALLTLKGVIAAKVYREEGIAIVAYQPEQVHPEALVKAVQGAGQDGKHHYIAELLDLSPARKAQEIG
ncbi:MAG: cation transporter [Thermaceae bacterium]|nr:cation transporter [Thermaceae bacterium]